MAVGISTACFYPLQTELALEELGKNGVGTVEVFINATSELSAPILNVLRRIQQHYNMDIVSIHPFLSFGEGYMLFSEYERRFYDALEIYKKYFQAANVLGAKYVVIHGAKKGSAFDEQRYIDRFGKLAQLGQAAGICVAQENVAKHVSQDPAFLQEMQRQLQDLFHMVLDIKQAKRVGIPVETFIETIREDIVHVHISDHNQNNVCMPPGEGELDFSQLFKKLRQHGYRGDSVVEVYREDFALPSQLFRSWRYARKFERISE